MKIYIINGPNLNFLKYRNPNLYGGKGFEDYLEELKCRYNTIHIQYFQSNHEGYIIDEIQKNAFSVDGMIINAGGLTHTSISLRDCIEIVRCPVVEVHISDIENRESFRKVNYIKEVCQHSIIGKGLDGYEIALKYLIDKK